MDKANVETRKEPAAKTTYHRISFKIFDFTENTEKVITVLQAFSIWPELIKQYNNLRTRFNLTEQPEVPTNLYGRPVILNTKGNGGYIELPSDLPCDPIDFTETLLRLRRCILIKATGPSADASVSFRVSIDDFPSHSTRHLRFLLLNSPFNDTLTVTHWIKKEFGIEPINVWKFSDRYSRWWRFRISRKATPVHTVCGHYTCETTSTSFSVQTFSPHIKKLLSMLRSSGLLVSSNTSLPEVTDTIALLAKKLSPISSSSTDTRTEGSKMSITEVPSDESIEKDNSKK